MMKSPYYQLCPITSNSRFPSRHIRFVHRDPKLQEFHSLFSDIVKNSKKVVNSVVGKNTVNVLKILDRIIPDKYFGISKHRQLFYNVVKLIITSSANECIYMNQVVIGVNFCKIPWLKNFLTKDPENSKAQKVICRRYYGESQIWLLDKIVKPLVLRFYAPVRRGQMHEIEFVPRHFWMSYQTKVFNNMLKQKFLILDTRSTPSRGILKIKPKDGYKNVSNFRPIMKLKPDRRTNLAKIRDIAKKLRCAAQKVCKTKTSALYRLWKDYVSFTAGTPIFCAKIDIHDAFGNINIEYLSYILENTDEVIAISEESKIFLLGHIRNQYISFGKNKEGVQKIYQWKHGLLQGDRFSSVLCQLYLSHLDSIYLKKFYKETTLLHRTVDDYFFCSTNAEDVKEFINMMSSIHTLNANKTESNLPDYGHQEITYCGQIFNMDTKEVQRFFHFPKRIEIRHRFKFWNEKKPISCNQGSKNITVLFLRKAMSFASNNFLFKNLELNTQFNNEETVTKNFFRAMVMLAYKFDAAVMSLLKKIKHFEAVIIVIKQTVHKYAHRATQILNLNKGTYETGVLTFQVFLKIGFQAFKLVLRKRSQYNVHSIGSTLTKCVNRISIQRVNFQKFKNLPKCFNNISIQRRLPHHKSYDL